MSMFLKTATCLSLILVLATVTIAQEVLPEGGTPAAEAQSETGNIAPPAATESTPAAHPATDKIVDSAKQKVDEMATDVNQSKTAQEAASGLLKHIYLLAEKLSFPAFHWVAFAIMVSGVVSYTLQLVLAKLVVLTKLSLSFREILSDSLGLIISLIGLVLTTQAAAENSTFTQSPFAVLSATAAGIVVGFIFYRWGQAAEVEAVAGRKALATPPAKKK